MLFNFWISDTWIASKKIWSNIEYGDFKWILKKYYLSDKQQTYAFDMEDVASSVPAFLAMIMMVLTYSISNGIGIGCIAYTIITLFTGKYSKKDIMVTVISLLFIIRFAFITM